MLLKADIRLKILVLIVLLISFLMSLRIIYLSTRNVEEYYLYEKEEYSIKRGTIFDRNNKILAISDELKSVYANPKEIKDKNQTAKYLSNILGISYSSVFEKINSNKNFVWIKRKIFPNQEELINNLNLKGIYLKKDYKRFYPNSNLCSHILGFCDIDSRGVEGVEKSMDSYLISDSGIIENEEYKNQNSGYNISLTIDANLQAIGEYVLKEGAIRENADSATLIFADGKSGEILVMANYPDFNPNFYSEYKQKNFRNIAIFNQYEPGSVVKIFTIASLLDNGNITTNDYFECDGVFEKNGLKVKCTGIHGRINITGILKYSCNDATLQAADRISKYDLYNYFKLFGFGELTNILLPGEQPGIFRNVSNWSASSKLSIPIGQEISVNAMQIIRASTTFVNDGVMIEPFIIKNIYDSNYNIVKQFERKEIRRVLKKGISKIVLENMREATLEGSVHKNLTIQGIEFSAKSGTAQIFDVRQNKYSDNEVTSSLLTIFPSGNPRYIIYIIYHNPKGTVRWGGIICSKILNEFITKIVGYMDINKDDRIEIRNKDLVIDRNYNYILKFPAKMPDLIGLSAGDAINIFSQTNIKIKVYGNGRIINQIPAQDEIIDENVEIKLFLK